MKKILGPVLILLAIVSGIYGITKFQDSSSSAEILGVELEANDSSGQQTAYLLLGGAVALLGGGLFLLKK